MSEGDASRVANARDSDSALGVTADGFVAGGANWQGTREEEEVGTVDVRLHLCSPTGLRTLLSTCSLEIQRRNLYLCFHEPL